MKERNVFLFLNDIFDAINSLEEFSLGLTRERFFKDRLRQSAIIRQLEIIGEASKQVPELIRKKYSSVPWREISGFRDVLIHNYFGADLDKIWLVIEKDLPVLKKQISEILKNEEKLKKL